MQGRSQHHPALQQHSQTDTAASCPSSSPKAWQDFQGQRDQKNPSKLFRAVTWEERVTVAGDGRALQEKLQVFQPTGV